MAVLDKGSYTRVGEKVYYSHRGPVWKAVRLGWRFLGLDWAHKHNLGLDWAHKHINVMEETSPPYNLIL